MFLALFYAVVVVIESSPGDRSSWYRSCFAKCASDNCGGDSSLPTYSFPLSPLPCSLSCKSTCIESSDKTIREKWNKTVQFFGKWPFRRIGNCEELASCVFSVGNLMFTIAGFIRAKRRYPTVNDKILLFHAVVCSTGWLFSAQFHARETSLSERMDYLGAAAIVYSTLFISLVRNFERFQSQFGITVFWCYCYHVYHMAGKIDYGLNMKICVLLGILSVALWVRVYLVERSEALFKVTLVSIASSLLLGLEILDFTPLYRIFDAHSLWHCGTMPVPWLLYPALMEDLQNRQMTKLKVP